jgi:hypothetical protein
MPTGVARIASASRLPLVLSVPRRLDTSAVFAARQYATGKAAPKERIAVKRAPRQVEKDEDDDEGEADNEMVFTSEDAGGSEQVEWSWIGEFPKEDFTEKTDRVAADKNWELEPLDKSSFANYLICTKIFVVCDFFGRHF